MHREIDLREQEEDDESAAHDHSKGNPATPVVPAAVATDPATVVGVATETIRDQSVICEDQ